MTRKAGSWLMHTVFVVLGLAGAPAYAQEDTALGFERTPPRLSFTDGEVSYWRPGASDWSEARVNSALAAGDELATGEAANLELQVGSRAWVRAGEASQLGLTSLEPDFLQMKLTTGTAALAIRYGLYYGLVVPLEVFGRTLAYGFEGGVDEAEGDKEGKQ